MERVVIIGAGLTGAALAWHLARAGAGVTVLEAGLHAASQASGRSFGWINASFYQNEAHQRLRVAGIAAHHRMARDLGAALWQWPGCLWWEDAAGFDAMAGALTALGYPVREVGQAEIARREPALARPPARALLFPQEGAVDAADLTRALLTAAVGLGAQALFGIGADRLFTRNGVVCGVETAGGVFEADQVIVAAGTGAARLLADVGFVLPMLQRPGLILTTQPVAPLLHHILAMPGQDVRQDFAGRLIAPLAAHHQADASETAPTDPLELVSAALRRLRETFGGLHLRADQVALAYRPVPGDGLPAVGAVAPGLWLAVMHSGVTLGPVVAQGLAAQVLGRGADPLLAPLLAPDLTPDLTPCAPGRFWS